MDWSVQQIATLAGTTSRTLRHYDDVGLLKPSRTGNNGYRYYGQDALVRLQRILLLRDLGLGRRRSRTCSATRRTRSRHWACTWNGCSRNRTGWAADRGGPADH